MGFEVRLKINCLDSTVKNHIDEVWPEVLGGSVKYLSSASITATGIIPFSFIAIMGELVL